MSTQKKTTRKRRITKRAADPMKYLDGREDFNPPGAGWVRMEEI